MQRESENLAQGSSYNATRRYSFLFSRKRNQAKRDSLPAARVSKSHESGLPCPACIFSHASCSTGVNSAGPVSLDMVMYDRTQCPVCRVKFARGMARPHYQERHPLYARWADRWFVSLVLLMVSATVGYYFLLPGPITLPRMLFVAYFFGGLVALATYRLWYERDLKTAWDADHPARAPS